jgi:hypothetical protein
MFVLNTLLATRYYAIYDPIGALALESLGEAQETTRSRLWTLCASQMTLMTLMTLMIRQKVGRA